MTQRYCRLCGEALSHTLVDLGETALANSYIRPEDLDREEATYPLHARVCGHCFLVQVEDVTLPQEIFSDYAYFSSYSDSWVAHAKRYAEETTERLGLNRDSLVVEVASNDGYLLQHFVALDIPVLGIEPAANIASVAEQKGVRTRVDFFGRGVAQDIARKTGRADLTAANNVLAHVPDINDFMSGFAAVLKDDGVSTFEFPHLLNLIEQVQFDTIYHEHYSYLSLIAVEHCLARHGMRAFDCQELPTHGGSLRLWCCLESAAHAETEAIRKLRRKESDHGLDRLETYRGFAEKVAAIRRSFLTFLESARNEGKTVAAYGAAAKGNTFLNYCGATADDIRFVADANPHKQQKYLPGSHIPIYPPDHIRDARPDYLLILPWNLKDEISHQVQYIRGWDGRFVVASPEITVW